MARKALAPLAAPLILSYMPWHMRRFDPFSCPLLTRAGLPAVGLCLLAGLAALPAAAQVTIDPNALNRLGGAQALPVPPAPLPAPRRHSHPRPHPAYGQAAMAQGGPTKARSTAHAPGAPASSASASRAHASGAEASGGGPPAAANATVHASGLGPSFATLPSLPGVAPPLPPPPHIVTAPPPPAHAAARPAKPPSAPAPAPIPAPTVAASAVPAPAVVPAAPPATPPASAAAPKPATPQPATPQPATPTAAAAPAALPRGADRLTLPYTGTETALPAAERAILRDFVRQYGPGAQYQVNAFASQPAGDSDPSTPRRIALERARGLTPVMVAAGASADHIRLITRGNAGGTPADRVEVIAIPPQAGHTAPAPSP